MIMVDRSEAFMNYCKSSLRALGGDDLIFPSGKTKSEKEKSQFTKQAQKILLSLEAVLNEILENYAAYTNYGLFPDNKDLTNIERDKLENNVSNQLGVVEEELESLRKELKCIPVYDEGSYLAFKETVSTILAERFQDASKIFGQLQMTRMKRVLASRPALCSYQDVSMARRNIIETPHNMKMREEERWKYKEEPKELEITEEERNAFEFENLQLQSKLNEELLEARQAEQQLTEFSQLLSVFNEKLVSQSEMIGDIYEHTEKSVKQVRKGNKQLKMTDERMKNDIQLFIAFIIASIILLIYDY